MLYLAEVQKKSRVLGSGRAEFRLLACQRGEQSWSAVPGEEIVAAPDDVNYNAGALVMVELTASKQIQRHSEAGRQLVSILQNFSRLQEKAKTQEEEIEQWKQSLTYQSQELNRREMEMEARQEQLQQMEEDVAKLEEQRQEIEGTRTEVNRLKEEFERKNQELEGAWAHLRGEMSRLEEKQAEFQHSTALDAEQAHQIQELLNRLSGAVAPTEVVREQLNQSFEIINQQQGSFDYYWQNLEQQRSSAQQLQEEADRQEQEIQSRWHEWHQSEAALEQSQAELLSQQNVLQLKQDHAHVLTERVHLQDSIYQQICRLAEESGKVHISGDRVDTEALEKMPLEGLQNLVRDLEQDLEKVSRFVNSQEEELTLQQQTIEELQQRIQNASEYDRLQMDSELTDERESYEMLNETLVGQRRNLQERQEVLRRHQFILARRQGLPVEEGSGNDLDLGPVLEGITELKQKMTQELRKLEEEIRQLQSSLDQLRSNVAQQVSSQEAKLNDLKQFEQTWKAQRVMVAETWGKLTAYQETLQPAQDSINGLREKLESTAGVMAQFQEVSDHQLQAIAEMRQLIESLTSNQAPEFIAS